MTVDPSLCAFCAHYSEDSAGPPACAAFPGGIPEAVWNGDVLHLVTLPGQRGFLAFAERPGLSPDEGHYVMGLLMPLPEED